MLLDLFNGDYFIKTIGKIAKKQNIDIDLTKSYISGKIDKGWVINLINEYGKGLSETITK